MEIAGERAKLLRAIALTTKVSEEKVTFTSYLPEYPPIEQCQEKLTCSVEVGRRPWWQCSVWSKIG